MSSSQPKSRGREAFVDALLILGSIVACLVGLEIAGRIIANRASLPEIAGDAALAVEPDDPEAAADAIYRGLTDSSLRAGLITRGLGRAARFTWDSTARATLALYHAVLGY